MTPTNLAPVDNIHAAVSRGVDFLQTQQLSSGEFKTLRYSDQALKSEPRLYSTPYGTTYVLYSLAFVDDARVQTMTDQAIEFLLMQMETPGLWRYYGSDNQETLAPDLDDTACAAFALKDRHDYIRLGLNHRLFLLNRDPEGRFRTFFIDKDHDNICGLVNANVVLYLGEREETQATCDYLNALVSGGAKGELSLYGVHDLLFYYVVMRAYSAGATRLGASRQALIERVVACRGPDGSFGGNEINTAFAVCSLLGFGYEDTDLIGEALRYLLARQHDSGAWPAAAFYIDFGSGFYGSEEVTTALCIEALARAMRRS